MKITFETLNLLLLLFPGLLSSRIVQLVRRKEKHSHIDMAVDVLIYSFLTYVIVEGFYTWQPILTVDKEVGGTFNYVKSTDFYSILLTLLVSILLPLFAGTIIHHDIHMKLLRLLKVTNRTSRETAWDDVFTSQSRFVTVHFKNEKRLTGWPMFYSNTPDEGFLYVHEGAWIGENNEYIETYSHGILVNKEDVEFIEFMLTDKERGKVDEQ